MRRWLFSCQAIGREVGWENADESISKSTVWGSETELLELLQIGSLGMTKVSAAA